MTNGNGLPGQDVILPGTYSPGHSPGTAEFGSLTLTDTSHLIMEIAGRDPGQYDHISVSGELVFDGILEIRLYGGFMPIDGDAFDLFDWGSASGAFDEILLPVLKPGLAWDLSNLYIDGTVDVVDPPIDGPAVPAPPAVALLAIGIIAIAVLQRRLAVQPQRFRR